MRLEAINLGRRETIRLGARTLDTGIDKSPVERAHVGPLGLAGDVVADETNHGGPDQAVYLYSRADYDWWEGELGRPLASGTFGENLTVSDFGARELHPGDRLRIGPVLLELSSARIPCSVFANHMCEEQWVKRFRDAERPGPYARVLEPGDIGTGMTVELLPAPDGPTILDSYRLYYDKGAPVETIRRLLAAPVSARERAKLEERLAELGAEGIPAGG